MTLADWLNLFKGNNDSKIFQVNHLKLLTSLNDHALRVSLSRLARKKAVTRICRGFYANPFNPPTLEEIAGQIYQPSYISLESALAAYGVLSQIPRVLTCVTTQLPHTFKTGYGIIEYRQIKSAYFTGFRKQNNHFIAEAEKALADYLYLTPKKDRSRKIAGLDTSRLNRARLNKHLKRMAIAREEKGSELFSILAS